MQHYHMARILLLVNKPHETTMRRSTIAHRLNSYRSIEEKIVSKRNLFSIAMKFGMPNERYGSKPSR